MTLRPGWWEGHVIPPAVRPYLISYEFGKSSTRLFTGRLLWDYLVACGLQIHAVLEIAQVHHICTVYDLDFTFNPNSRWGKQILALPYHPGSPHHGRNASRRSLFPCQGHSETHIATHLT